MERGENFILQMESFQIFTPEVITTDWNRLNTGLIANEASMQLKCIVGFKT